MAFLEIRDFGVTDQGMVDLGHRVLPNKHLFGNFRPEVAGARTHIAVCELEPSAGKGVGKFVGVLVEAAGDLVVSGIDLEREVGS